MVLQYAMDSTWTDGEITKRRRFLQKSNCPRDVLRPPSRSSALLFAEGVADRRACGRKSNNPGTAAAYPAGPRSPAVAAACGPAPDA